MKQLIDAYDPGLPIESAVTPPSGWYTDESFAKHENDAVFARNWIVACRLDQLRGRGDYVATQVAGEPVILVRTDELLAFYNVCRHHAAEIMEPGTGCAKVLKCPYHGWTYGLDGELRGAPHFEEARNFDRKENGLVPLRVDSWEKWVFVCLDEDTEPLSEYLGKLHDQLERFCLDRLSFHKTAVYDLDCNWKVFVDNYLDGGYHVPVLHGGLSGALDCSDYLVSVEDRYCLQHCPTGKSDDEISAVRTGDRAFYYWQYPNFMINPYEGVMDTNLVVPLSASRCRVYFDYYFDEDPGIDREFKDRSVEVAHQVQVEDESICVSVQRGLASRAYDTGRLSPEKEGGEHLFHRLLHRDLQVVASGATGKGAESRLPDR